MRFVCHVCHCLMLHLHLSSAGLKARCSVCRRWREVRP